VGKDIKQKYSGTQRSSANVQGQCVAGVQVGFAGGKSEGTQWIGG